MSRWAVILAGGSGTRFWPLSTPALPKQLLPLVDGRSLLSTTISRLSPIVPIERILVLTNESLVDATLRYAPELSDSNMIAEPRAAGTAPALAWAARRIAASAGPGETMICVHADWFVGDEEGFRGAVQRAADVAERRDCLVTVGVVPDRPETGFGYIQPGEGIEEETGAFEVRRFVEKPGADDAARFCKEGFLWNSGIFAWKAGRFLSEIQRLTPEVADALTRSTDIRSFFSAVRPVSVDHGVLERSSRVVVMPGDFGWDDVGTWASLRRVLPADEDGNVVRGRAALVESHGNVVFAGDAPVVLFGVDDLVVVNSAGTTLVTTVQRASDLKILLEALPAEMR